MTKDDEPVDDLQSDLSTHTPASRLDYGDAEQRAEMDGVDDMPAEGPVPLVDAPMSSLGSVVDRRLREPFNQAQKRRNQRRMPT